MKFWDTSAVVPLCLEESTSPSVRRILEADPEMVVWWGTRSECVSALERRRREGSLSPAEQQLARKVLNTLTSVWIEVQPSEDVRIEAERVLELQPLRTADAFQLAAAIEWCKGRSTYMEFVVFDRRLRNASQAEGFSVVPAIA